VPARDGLVWNVVVPCIDYCAGGTARFSITDKKGAPMHTDFFVDQPRGLIIAVGSGLDLFGTYTSRH
jgi:hypothetical protein